MKTIVDYCNMCYDVWENECTKLANKIIPAVEDVLTLRALGVKDVLTLRALGAKYIKPITVPKRKFTPMIMAGLAHDIYSKGGEI